LKQGEKMISQKIQQVLSMSLCTILLVQGVAAQTSPQPSSTSAPPAVAPLTTDQLDALVAPIALYPDALVAQVLAAAGYPDQVAFADDWLNQNTNLQGAALTQQVDQQPWDPSVKALTQFPSVLHDLAKNLSWTSNLGQAFTNQQSCDDCGASHARQGTSRGFAQVLFPDQGGASERANDCD
jgi:hypothetical protein